ncbi:unnamed protein product [Caenorhabditis bovis]|uniref:receptor protein serine/threonine kinase n=1 Tax=Caenorhabditis bovis TaxID=2654633 RepID=A0A8S1FAB1_9PELO|nr:unnamed protein product [Caenorhabditis bovis]
MDATKLKLCRCSLANGCDGLTKGWLPNVLYGNISRSDSKWLNEVCVTDGKCYQSIRAGPSIHAFGCIDVKEEKDKLLPDMPGFEAQICTNLTDLQYQEDEYWICCDSKNFCANQTLLPTNFPTRFELTVPPVHDISRHGFFGYPIVLGMSFVAVTLLIGFGCGYLVWYLKNGGTFTTMFKSKNRTILIHDSDRSVMAPSTDMTSAGGGESIEMSSIDHRQLSADALIKHQVVFKLLSDLESTSGSGSGPPILQERTISHQITLNHQIGNGRFGTVYCGSWHFEQVAVKVFNSCDEMAYLREVMIYETKMLRHPNILRFIGNDRADYGENSELWLVTEYHPLGSVYDYLLKNTIDVKQCFDFIRSSANGIAFLHSEIISNRRTSKPGIAHRDIKTRNIMVKNDMTCAIGDFGLSVTIDPNTGKIDVPPESKCGTTRYLAPEILAGSLQTNLLESYKMADMYAFSLVMWECLMRTEEGRIRAHPPEECIPYLGDVQRDPPDKIMCDIVYNKSVRPRIPNEWMENPSVRLIIETMRECWATNPTARLSALQVRMKLEKKQNELPQLINIDEKDLIDIHYSPPPLVRESAAQRTSRVSPIRKRDEHEPLIK